MGPNLDGFSKLLQGVNVNLVEFIFAVTAVFGSTGIIMAWTSFTYAIEQRSQENKKEAIRVRVIDQHRGE